MQDDLFDRGLKARREVLGDDYVNSALAASNGFAQPLQDYITKYCWGDVWSRPGLPRKTRSMLNLAMLAALNRPHELKLHVRGALRNGVTKEEIAEVFLQVAVYCGAPAALDGFRVAKQVLDDPDQGPAAPVPADAAGP
jgi:4-carboxymuconolactone decarboxylase